jgi:DNA-binding GntR family transcriptional regulator
MSQLLADATYRFENLPDIVHDYLRQRIVAGTVAAGSPLRQETIASELGISRVPVREALKRLEAEGLVKFRPRRGYLVSELDPEEIVEIFEIRGLLEKQGAGLAARQRTEDDIAEVEALVLAMDEALDPAPDSIDLFARLNREFHARLVACSRRPRLCRLLENLRDQVEGYVRIDATTLGRLAEAQAEHHEIFEAFRAGDARQTARLCAAHSNHTSQNVLSSLARRATASAS